MNNKNLSGTRVFVSVILYVFLLIFLYIFTVIQTIVSVIMFRVFDYKTAFRRTMFFVLNNIYLHFLGIKTEIRGLENLPKDSCILMSKHSSSIETMLFVCLVDVGNVCPVAKKELFFIPFFNFFLFYVGAISVNRNLKGIESFFSLIKKVKNRLKKGSKVLIFPEGTRTDAGTESKFHLGIMKLYPEIIFVPVALNSSTVFGKSLHSPKKPGKLIIEFLPQVPNNIEPSEARRLVSKTISSHSKKLALEAFM